MGNKPWQTYLKAEYTITKMLHMHKIVTTPQNGWRKQTK